MDLGFSNYFRPAGKFPFKEGHILSVSGSQYAVRGTPDELFTYRVYVDEVTDGDTLWVLVDLGFGITTKQCLRLRGLDCPEIATRDGQEAKRFVEKELGITRSERMSKSSRAVIGTPVTITSTKSDKYDRYLADVWVGETYLNQELLDKGLAVRMED